MDFWACLDFHHFGPYLQGMFNRKRLKIACAMSGGADSTAAALILKSRGYKVEGFTLRMVGKESPNARSCCSQDAVDRAVRVCEKLNIPHTVLWVQSIFRDSVIKDFIESYRAGRTPNPCILCNRHVKFGYLLDRVLDLGFDLMATGHYARLVRNILTRNISLYRSRDEKKDQTYFLSRLKPESLGKIIFPLQNISKTAIIRLITKSGIWSPSVQESQDICFLEHWGDYRDYLRSKLDPSSYKEGEIIDSSGKVLGRHQGLPFYTVGQRKGLRLSHSEPLYVKNLDSVKNQITAVTNQEMLIQSFKIKNLNFFCKTGVSGVFSVKIRYQSRPEKVRMRILPEKRAELTYFGYGYEVTPGQQAVLYKGKKLIGSGEIEQDGVWENSI